MDEGNKLKSLVISGDAWEFTGPKRLLQFVSDVVLIHINKDAIFRKVAPMFSYLPGVKMLRLIDNSFCSLKEVLIFLTCLLHDI